MAGDYTSNDPNVRLQAVREAIAACLTAQDYSIAGRQKRMAELQQLWAMEKELMQLCDLPSQLASVAMQTRVT